MNELDNNISADEEVETFEHVPNAVVNLLNDFFYELKSKATGYEPARYLNDTIAFLDNHPNAPEKDTCVSFQVDDTSFSVIYTSYKIELSDYISENGDWGSDHNQRFNFRYEIEGYSEQEGDLDEFRSLLFNCLNEVKVTDINISEEE
jgi:hypothetical protein